MIQASRRSLDVTAGLRRALDHASRRTSLPQTHRALLARHPHACAVGRLCGHTSQRRPLRIILRNLGNRWIMGCGERFCGLVRFAPCRQSRTSQPFQNSLSVGNCVTMLVAKYAFILQCHLRIMPRKRWGHRGSRGPAGSVPRLPRGASDGNTLLPWTMGQTVRARRARSHRCA